MPRHPGASQRARGGKSQPVSVGSFLLRFPWVSLGPLLLSVTHEAFHVYDVTPDVLHKPPPEAGLRGTLLMMP